MNKIININRIPIRALHYITDADAPIYNEGKKWSFSNIYYLENLRNIYIITRDSKIKTLKEITLLVQESITSGSWKERKVLEYLNALVNFQILNRDYSIRKLLFNNRNIQDPLNKEDILVFKEIFFSYFRFKEISSWFISPTYQEDLAFITEALLIDKSVPVFYLSLRNRFVDSLIYNLEEQDFIYAIEDSMSHQMRFWDVFLKWGTTIGVLDKFSLSKLGIKTNNHKEISIVYFIKPFQPFDLISYIKTTNYFFSREIYLPDLIFKLASHFRFSVDDLKAFIVDQITNNEDITYERTSQIFIIKAKKDSEIIKKATYLYPQIDDNFISHIILRKWP